MDDKAPHLLSVSDTAERLNISQRTVYRLIDAGEIPALRVGGSIRVDDEELRSYIYDSSEES